MKPAPFNPLKIPPIFFEVPYESSQYPGNPSLKAFHEGANCQLFAYELLKFFGKELPPLRSSNLWEDTTYTVCVVDKLLPLDLLLWNNTKEAYGAHVGVCLGNHTAIHLSKKEEYATIWELERFGEYEAYTFYIGAKRVRG